MKYRNKRTGAVIVVNSKVSGENWEEVTEQGKTAEKPSPVRKKAARKEKGKQDGKQDG